MKFNNTITPEALESYKNISDTKVITDIIKENTEKTLEEKINDFLKDNNLTEEEIAYNNIKNNNYHDFIMSNCRKYGNINWINDKINDKKIREKLLSDINELKNNTINCIMFNISKEKDKEIKESNFNTMERLLKILSFSEDYVDNNKEKKVKEVIVKDPNQEQSIEELKREIIDELKEKGCIPDLSKLYIVDQKVRPFNVGTAFELSDGSKYVIISTMQTFGKLLNSFYKDINNNYYWCVCVDEKDTKEYGSNLGKIIPFEHNTIEMTANLL